MIEFQFASIFIFPFTFSHLAPSSTLYVVTTMLGSMDFSASRKKSLRDSLHFTSPKLFIKSFKHPFYIMLFIYRSHSQQINATRISKFAYLLNIPAQRLINFSLQANLRQTNLQSSRFLRLRQFKFFALL